MIADLDVIVIGAGVAGLAALVELECAGVKSICLEARDRIGGRIFTLHDPLSPIPIELGAEFIHGRPPEIWDLLSDIGLTAYDCTEKSLHIKNGKVQKKSDAWLMIDEILDDMQRVAREGPDRTFAEFLQQRSYDADARELAQSYVQGFNAAHADVIGIASLAKESAAADTIEGDRAFRILNGYDSIPLSLARRTRNIHLNAVVESVGWSPGSVSAHVRSAITGEISSVRAKKAIITAPLAVLQTGAIRFDPEPTRNLRAARELCFGQVVRVVFRFRQRIWDRNPELSDAGFLLSDGPVFPTWWTPLPMRAPILTGWSAGPKADALAATDRPQVIARAVEQLANVTGIAAHELQASLDMSYYHDWATDPFARGAYSYVPAGAAAARERLAEPVQNTLFFAGEATDFSGHSATVHGAIASGRRATREVLQR